MDRRRSEERLREFQSKSFKSRRETRTFYWRFRTSPEGIFPLLCATREADWLDGATHELIFTDSGYAEKDYVFKSDFFGLGDEVWVRFDHVENESLAYYRFSEHALVKFEIRLRDNYDGTVSTRWQVTYTGLNDRGNQIIDELPPKLELDGIMESLQYYLERGERRNR